MDRLENAEIPSPNGITFFEPGEKITHPKTFSHGTFEKEKIVPDMGRVTIGLGYAPPEEIANEKKDDPNSFQELAIALSEKGNLIAGTEESFFRHDLCNLEISINDLAMKATDDLIVQVNLPNGVQLEADRWDFFPYKFDPASTNELEKGAAMFRHWKLASQQEPEINGLFFTPVDSNVLSKLSFSFKTKPGGDIN